MTIKVSKHAKLRVQQRAGVPKGSARHLANNAFLKGLTQDDFEGGLAEWVRNKLIRPGIIPRIHAQKLFLFDGKKTLITVIDVPEELIDEIRIAKEAGVHMPKTTSHIPSRMV